MKKNLTLSIDEDLLNKARVYAAMEKTSVNEMIRRFLVGTIDGSIEEAKHREKAFKRGNRDWIKLFEDTDASSDSRQRRVDNPNRIFDREELYEEAFYERGLL